MLTFFGFFIIGFFIGGISMAVAFIKVCEDDTNKKFNIHLEFPDIKEIPPEVNDWLKKYYQKDKDIDKSNKSLKEK